MNPAQTYLQVLSQQHVRAIDHQLLSTPSQSPIMFKHYVALEVDGIPKFSSSPVPHDNRMSAAAEADRLARKFPGKTFGIYTRNDDASSTFRYVPEYTGSQLFNGEASAGVYKPVTGYADVRLVATGNSRSRMVTYVSAGAVAFEAEPAKPWAWSTTKFHKVDERLSFVKTA